MSSLITWTNYPTNGQVTNTWNYNPYRGWLDNKLYPDNSGPSYSYTDAGRLATRTWARGISTSYSYDNNGLIKTIDYSDATPDVTFAYDRAGRATDITDIGTRSYAYNYTGQILADAYSALGSGTTLQYGYDAFLRRSSLTNTAPNTKYFYGYDAAGRLDNLNDQANFISYTYTANSPLISTVSFKENATLRLSTSYTYDYLNRLTSVESTPQASGEQPLKFGYGYNSANQRENVTLADFSRWKFQYDSLGQLNSGKKYWSDSLPVAGEQFEYSFDSIGNRRSTKSGGDASASGLRSANYTINDLNQITSRDVPGTIDIIGAATATNVVTVNGNQTYRHGEFYQYPLSVSNTGTSVWQSVTVAITGTSLVTNGNTLVPPATQNFQYDADGNLTNDLVWTYVWDAENRLIQMINETSVPSSARKQLDFSYDHLGRRYRKLVSTWNGSAYAASQTNYFFYDGWLLAAEASPGITAKTYLWGVDKSGEPSWIGGAAGVGGLVVLGYGSEAYYPAYDGNGNVHGLTAASDGIIKAIYEYGPFGEAIRASGSAAKLNSLRFSTKYTDDETGFLPYGFRYYNPSIGRWLNQDPIGQAGGLNLYRFNYNNPLSYIDPDGMAPQLVGVTYDPLTGISSGQYRMEKFGDSVRARKLRPLEPSTLEQANRTLNAAAEATYDPNATAIDATSMYLIGAGLTILGVVELIPDASLVTKPCAKVAAKNVVYREISAADRIALEAGQPLVPKGTGGSILEHVRGQPTGHISASQTVEGTARFRGGNGLVEIDVNAATSGGTQFIPHPQVLEALGARPKQIQKVLESREVLFNGPIPANAVRLIP